MPRNYEIEATFVAHDDDETAAWIESRLRSLGCSNVFVTADEDGGGRENDGGESNG